jgi:hypothetical protein
VKTEKGVQGTGPHRVKLLADKETTGTDPITGKEIPVIAYLVEENGQKKSYRVPKIDKKGEIHYLVQRFAEINEGEEVILEMKRRGIKNYVEVIRVKDIATGEVDEEQDDETDIPIINIDAYKPEN